MRLVHLPVLAAIVGTPIAGFAAPALPNEARHVIQSVHRAASSGDFTVLRRSMVQDFQWSFGGDRDADQAIDAWRADAKYLRNLKRVTAQPCAFVTPAILECPAKARIGFRAGFEKAPDGWRMTYFVEGD